MLISKNSRRRSDQFESRFRDGLGGEFPVRQYLRCREDFTSGLIHLIVLGAFAFTLAMFGRTVGDLFDNHGAALNPWYRRLAFTALAVFVLSVLRRMYYKVMDLRDIRREMRRLKGTFRDQGD